MARGAADRMLTSSIIDGTELAGAAVADPTLCPRCLTPEGELEDAAAAADVPDCYRCRSCDQRWVVEQPRWVCHTSSPLVADRPSEREREGLMR